MDAARRLSGVLLSVAWITLLVLPLDAVSVAAAPPKPVRATQSESAEIATGTAIGNAPTDALPDPLAKFPEIPVANPGDDNAPEDAAKREPGSVRPRGLEAPVDLKPQAAAEPATEEDDPGDGPVGEEAKGSDNSKDAKASKNGKDAKDSKRSKDDKASNDESRAAQDERVWPIPEESYTFSQEFGCVPQLGNLYFPGEGCPTHAPVIHTGIDMAAPEGTLFYAAAAGWVTLAGYDRPTSDANTRIIIQHVGRNEDYSTEYLHWVASYVEVGDYVEAGDPIGEVGNVGYSTGPHLHFSVVDLVSGEHIDPVRWLPEQTGSDAYRGRRPEAEARFRLPPGTTWGQPESADPAPPDAPEREAIPASPPADGERSERRANRDARGGQDQGSGKDDAKKRDGKGAGKDRHNGDAAANEETATSAGGDESTGEAKTRERTRKRERHKDGTDSQTSESGENAGDADDTDSTSREKRRNRESSDDTGSSNDDKNGRRDEDRTRRDDEQDDDGGGRDRSGGKGDSGKNDNNNDKDKDQDQDDRSGGHNNAGDGNGGKNDNGKKGKKRGNADVGAETDNV